MDEISDDYLFAEGRLKAALEALKPEGLKQVYNATDLADVEERSQMVPAAHILYWGDVVGTSAQGATQNHVTQTWVVVLAVKLRRDGAHPGQLLAKLIRAVQGISSGQFGTFKRVTAPTRPGFRNGFGYYPLAFNVTYRMKGN